MMQETSLLRNQLVSSGRLSETETREQSRVATSIVGMINAGTSPIVITTVATIATMIAATNAITATAITRTATRLPDQMISRELKTSRINPATTKMILGADAECSNTRAKHV